MGKRTRKTQKTRTPKRTSGLNQELTIVATAGTMEEARELEMLLKDNDIAAVVKQQKDEFGDGKHYAIMASEEVADEAHVVIESQDTYDDIYDFAEDDENEEDTEGDIFEEGS